MFNTQPGAAQSDMYRPNGIKLTIVSDRCLEATVSKFPSSNTPLFRGNNNRFVSHSTAGERQLNICSGLPKATLQHGTGVCARVCLVAFVRACMRVFV